MNRHMGWERGGQTYGLGKGWTDIWTWKRDGQKDGRTDKHIENITSKSNVKSVNTKVILVIETSCIV